MTGASGRCPLIFLDVDGTLLPLGSPGGVSGFALAQQVVVDGGNPLLGRLNPRHGAALVALGGELVWASAWMHDANVEIAPRLSLPALPVVRWPDDDDDVVDHGGLHWKTRHLVAFADGRAFVWIDDEITPADRAWVAAHHPGHALLHTVDGSRGLTETDFAAIAGWVALLPGRGGR